MVLTNKFNLPQPFVDAVSTDEYVRGDADYTTTELVSPPRILSLLRKHQDELIEDASDRVWALSGQSRHIVLERIAGLNPERYIVEKRFQATVGDNIKISGKIDLFDRENLTLYDWKETSVWKFIMGDTREWEQQGNINLLLMIMNGYEVKNLSNIAILKDWKARRARVIKRGDYPQCAIHVKPLPMWPPGDAMKFILRRIEDHRAEADMPRVCTSQERWQRDTQFAVMQKGRKRAIRLFSEFAQAEALFKMRTQSADPGQKFYIEERPMEPVRCLDFCPVQQFCDFGKTAVEKWRKQNESSE